MLVFHVFVDYCVFYLGFPDGSVVNYLPASVGDTGVVDLVPGSSERSPEGGNGNPLRYSCLGNLMDRGAWRATVHGVTKESDTTEQLSVHACFFFFKYIDAALDSYFSPLTVAVAVLFTHLFSTLTGLNLLSLSLHSVTTDALHFSLGVFLFLSLVSLRDCTYVCIVLCPASGSSEAVIKRSEQ